MMKKRLLSMLMAGAMFCGIMAGCGGDSSTPDGGAGESSGASAAQDGGTGDKTKVGVILKTLSSEYWGYVVAGVRAAEADFGVEVVLQGAASETNFDEQMNMIETMLSAGEVQAMAIAPLQPDMVATKVADASIPILAVDTKIPSDNVLTFIGTGNEEAAYQGGKYAAELAIAQGSANPVAVVISGVQGDLTVESRLAGYTAGFEEAGGSILSVQYADAVADKAVSVMENFMQTYDTIDAVLCNNDDMAMAASRAAKAAGRENIIFCGFDGISSACQAIIDGNETCSVAQDPYAMGYKAVELALAAIGGEALEDFVDTGCQMVTPENAQEYLDKLNAMLNG